MGFLELLLVPVGFRATFRTITIKLRRSHRECDRGDSCGNRVYSGQLETDRMDPSRSPVIRK